MKIDYKINNFNHKVFIKENIFNYIINDIEELKEGARKASFTPLRETIISGLIVEISRLSFMYSLKLEYIPHPPFKKDTDLFLNVRFLQLSLRCLCKSCLRWVIQVESNTIEEVDPPKVKIFISDFCQL